MSSAHPPLTCKEMKAILLHLGFVKRDQTGSHEQWIKDAGGRRFKVTLDCPKSPFSPILIASMAAQAGISKKELYRIHKTIS